MLTSCAQGGFRRLRFGWSRLGRRARQESGLTLPELLVVCLIVGILAAIFVPSFLAQTNKAVDVQAKALARTAQTAAEAIATDENGRYDKVSTLELNQADAAIRIGASSSEAYLSAASGSKDEYSVTAKATNGDEFKLTRTPSGDVVRACASPLTKTGCSGGEKGTW